MDLSTPKAVPISDVPAITVRDPVGRERQGIMFEGDHGSCNDKQCADPGVSHLRQMNDRRGAGEVQGLISKFPHKARKASQRDAETKVRQEAQSGRKGTVCHEGQRMSDRKAARKEGTGLESGLAGKGQGM